MKILIYGAGVIGCTYGWQLSKAGNDITVLVRKGRRQSMEENGINIHCSDFRGGQKRVEQTVFRPKVIDELSSQNEYEYIIVAVNCVHLKEILPVLAQSAGRANILFFQNSWNDFDEIPTYLSPEHYFFGFPFMVGGGKSDKGINSAISGSKYSGSLLGELNGTITPRVQKMAKSLNDAHLKPVLSTQITTWLIPHFAFIAAVSAGILKAGSTASFIHDSALMKETILSIREGFQVCSKRGVNPKKEKVNKLYYLPTFISIPVVKNIFSNESFQLMFDNYLNCSSDETKRMIQDILESGEQYNVKMPHLRSLQQSVEKLV